MLGMNVLDAHGGAQGNWGMHACQFYTTTDELLQFLVRYIQRGVENNEYCMWIASQAVTKEAARAALRQAITRFDEHAEQIEILNHDEWYLDATGTLMDFECVLANWIAKEREALARGFAGLRVTGDMCWIAKSEWRDAMHYESRVNEAIGGFRMKAVCSYPLRDCGAEQITHVLDHHQAVFYKKDHWWRRLSTANRNDALAALAAVSGYA